MDENENRAYIDGYLDALNHAKALFENYRKVQDGMVVYTDGLDMLGDKMVERNEHLYD